MQDWWGASEFGQGTLTVCKNNRRPARHIRMGCQYASVAVDGSDVDRGKDAVAIQRDPQLLL